MYTLQCTKKLLDRIKPEISEPQPSTTQLGNWYATALFWRPQMALFVNERTLFPVVMPLAPAATLAQRFPVALKAALSSLGLPRGFVDAEIEGMAQVTYAKTSNRAVLGVMNQFAFLAEGDINPTNESEALALSMKLSDTPCGPLYKGAVFPSRALLELVRGGAVH